MRLNKNPLPFTLFFITLKQYITDNATSSFSEASTMNRHYRYLPLSKVTPGTVLADDLLDKVGHVLLPAGTTLTERMLQAIAHHDIHQLSVEDEAGSEDEEPEYLTTKLSRIEKIFRQVGDAEPASILKSYVIDYRKGEAK
jgi:hypothetical protein